MLNEIKNVKQNEAKQHRRWFHDDYFDLYTWETFAGELLGFQLCYDKLGKQRALRYSSELGFSHEGIDEPEEKIGRMMSPIFVADGVFDPNGTGAIFERAAIALPASVKEFVMGRIREYQLEGKAL